MKCLISTFVIISIFIQTSISQNPTLSGTIWRDLDYNLIFQFEEGINGVKVNLRNASTNEIVDETITDNFEFNFPSVGSNPLTAGTYYLEIPPEEFDLGEVLSQFIPCGTANDADDGVDNDDNGNLSFPLVTTTFSLDTSHVDYVDICLFMDCNEEVLTAMPSCDQITEADIFCSISELNGLCGLMPDDNSPGAQPVPLCSDGGGAHNISWFAFIADEGNYILTVTPTGCVGSNTGQDGVQMGLYADCSFTESVYCDPICNTNPTTFDSDILDAGEVYYFFIDGCGGSVCSYEIFVDIDPIPYQIEIDELCILTSANLICEDAEFCADKELVFQTNYQKSSAVNTWKITTLSGGPYEGDADLITEENSLQLTFNNPGVYTVCIESVDNGCSSWEGNICRIVTIGEASSIEQFATISICENLLVNFDPSMLDDQDPNGDGILGWLDTSFVFTFGLNESIMVDSIFCAFEQHIFISPIDSVSISLNPNFDLLCIGDTLQFDLATGGVYDSIIWSVNNIIQTDEINYLIPEIGENNITATIFNVCGSNTDEVTIQVMDTISAPVITCDTTNANSIILSWSFIEGAVGYWFLINGDYVEVTDSFYVIEDLGFGEVVNIQYNAINFFQCDGSPKFITCTSADIVGLSEQSLDAIQITPNPTSDYLIIDGASVSLDANYRIYAINGRLMMTGNLNETMKIDVLDLSVGVYLITIDRNDDGKNYVERFVKN